MRKAKKIRVKFSKLRCLLPEKMIYYKFRYNWNLYESETYLLDISLNDTDFVLFVFLWGNEIRFEVALSRCSGVCVREANQAINTSTGWHSEV